jgi:hypothetical protein
LPEAIRPLLRQGLVRYRTSTLYRLRHADASAQILRTGLASATVKLHLGSGNIVLPDWVNPDEVHELATEILRILRPEGAVRMVVPGIERIIRAYVADDVEFFKDQARRHPANCTTQMKHLMSALQQDGEHKSPLSTETTVFQPLT